MGFSRYIVLLLFLRICITNGLYARDLYPVNGKILIENDDYRGVSVTLTEGDKTVNLEVSTTGIFTVNLDWNKTYFFKFSKPGFVSKIVQFSTFIPDDRSHAIEPFYMNVRLFPVFDGVDTVFFKKPVAKVYYDKKINDFTDDRDYALKVVYRIEQMKKRMPVNSQTRKPGQKKITAKRLSERSVVKNRVRAASDDNVKPELVSIPLNHKNAVDKKTAKKLGYNIPQLKDDYPIGKTVETFFIDNRQIKRVIIRSRDKQNVFIRVKHPWGGVFYFIDESPLGIFSVTEDSFRRYTEISVPIADNSGM